ncbi:MAG: tetratricopeptide repeat protein [Fimbriimonas sp.]|nr:tetratricopeptide repeat protein [Fimbriimonas sp.]
MLSAGAFLVVSIAYAQRGSTGYIPQINEGERAFARHEYIAAASHFRSALQWRSDGVEAHIGLGNVYLKIGRSQRALEEFAAALKIDRHSADAERGIHVARTEGQEQESFQQIESEAVREPRNADIHTTYAEELLERDRVAAAKFEAQYSLKLDAHQWHAIGVLGEVSLKEGKFAEARQYLETACFHDSRDDDSVFALGEVYLNLKDYPAAVKAFRQLVKLVPEESDGHRKLADALGKSGDKPAAQKELEIAQTIEAANGQKGGKD